jgi:hypothetical protein
MALAAFCRSEGKIFFPLRRRAIAVVAHYDGEDERLYARRASTTDLLHDVHAESLTHLTGHEFSGVKQHQPLRAFVG